MSRKFHRADDELVRSGRRFRDLLRLMASPEFPFVRVILANTLAMSLLGLAIPLSVQMVINNMVSTNLVQPLAMLCMILLFVLVFGGIVQVIQTFTVETLRRRLFVRHGLVIAERLTCFQDEHFRRENSQALINRIFDVGIMQSSMVTFVVDGFGFLVMFCIGFGLLAFYHPYFLAFAVAMALFLLLDWLLFGPDGVRAGSPEADAKYDVVGWVEELSRVRNMFASDRGRRYSSTRLTGLYNAWLKRRNELFTYQFRQHIGLQLFSVVTNVLLVFLGGMLVLERELSVGQLVAAALVVGNITSSLPRLQSFFLAVYDYSTSLDKIAQFYDYPLEADTSKLAPAPTADVRFNEVFVEPDYRFDFDLPAGQRIQAIVRSFSSVELLYDLMMGFRTPTSGYVLLGGRHLEDVDVARFRNDVQLVRRGQFFAGTIRQNLVGFGDREYDTAAIQAVLGRVGLGSIVEGLPAKLETELRPNGFPLSESHLMGLQIARAMLTRPKILLVTLDLEQIAEERRAWIVRELLDPAYGWTLLFFTQRPESEGFDRTVLLDRRGLHEIDG